MNHVVETYENYREEDRLTTNNGRRIEFLTTVSVFDSLFPPASQILDCAAGTGIYAFYLADRGHQVTATDITPRHVQIMQETLKEKPYGMETGVLDAVDMSRFADESFDVVLNMGPFYHLTDGEKRETCLRESVRVLKKGGLLAASYIPRTYIFPCMVLRNRTFLDSRIAGQILDTGVLQYEDEKRFWTDSYYSSAEEMEMLCRSHGLTVVDHFAQDGLTPLFSEKADSWTEEEFLVWCEYHKRICRERTILGSSNHVIILGKKEM